jgi:hypothetical protein
VLLDRTRPADILLEGPDRRLGVGGIQAISVVQELA